ERDDLVPPRDELVTVAPDRVLGVRERHPLRVAGVPGILRGLDLRQRGLLGERRERRSGSHLSLLGKAGPYLRRDQTRVNGLPRIRAYVVPPEPVPGSTRGSWKAMH